MIHKLLSHVITHVGSYAGKPTVYCFNRQMEKIVLDLLNRPTDGFIKDSGEMDVHDYETQEQRSWQQLPEEPTRRSNNDKTWE